jgi:hypothetical protein
MKMQMQFPAELAENRRKPQKTAEKYKYNYE